MNLNSHDKQAKQSTHDKGNLDVMRQKDRQSPVVEPRTPLA